MVVANSFDGLVYVPVSTASVDGAPYAEMYRNVNLAGIAWRLSGPGYDFVRAVPGPGDSATLVNADALNAVLDTLSKRFDAASFRGMRVNVTGEIRANDLLGYESFQANVMDAKAILVSTTRLPFASPPADAGWTPVSLTFVGPKTATELYAGVQLGGTGSVDMRNLAFTVAPAPTGASLSGAGQTTSLSDSWRLSGSTSTLYASSDTATGGWNGGAQIGLARTAAGDGFGSYAQQFPAQPYLGKTIHIFGMLRTKDVTFGSFWARVDGPAGAILGFDNMQGRSPVGTQDWTPFSIVLRVPANAVKINAGLLLVGSGAVYGSDLKIEIVPDSTPVTGTAT